MTQTEKQIAESKQPVVLAPDVTAPYWLRLTVPHPHLWNGRLDPYLYQAVVELRSTNGVVDSVEQPLGLRFYRVDPDKGFFLNGKPYALHGVDRHQDRWNKGWAISDADMDEDMRLIKEIGATVVRCAHYQHSDYFYSLCDQAGILVWAEIPQVNEINAVAAICRNLAQPVARSHPAKHQSSFDFRLESVQRNRAQEHTRPGPRIAGFEQSCPQRRPDAPDHWRHLHGPVPANEQNSRPARLEHLSGLVFRLGFA